MSRKRVCKSKLRRASPVARDTRLETVQGLASGVETDK